MTQAQPTPALHGQCVLITGGNGGIGKVTARVLAERGAHVVLACRDSDKTRAALDAISRVGSVEHLPVDLASLDSVRALAAAFRARHARLDVLINNAGTFPMRAALTADGFEMQFGVNHLAHFLLTDLLLDTLKASAPARVVTVSSMLHKRASLDFDSFRGAGRYNAQRAYGQSKLANVLFATELAARLNGSGVTSNVLHPGGVRTDITRGLPWLVRQGINLFFIPVEDGARTSIMLAADPALADVTGTYFDQCKRAEYSPLADDHRLRARLWEHSVSMTAAKS